MLACLHLEISSEHLFNKWSWSLKLTISSFSLRHNKHFFYIFEYDGTDFTNDHFNVDISLYFFLIYQIYLDNVVSFEYRLCLNDFVWLLYLFIKFSSAAPRLVLFGFIDVNIVHLYTMSCAWHCPFNGQSSLLLQLHGLMFPVRLFNNFLLWDEIKLDIFSVHE